MEVKHHSFQKFYMPLMWYLKLPVHFQHKFATILHLFVQLNLVDHSRYLMVQILPYLHQPIQIGVLIPAAANNISCININPCEDVAVNTLTPALLAPTDALIALCSDSTFTYFASIFSSATYCARYSEIVV